MAILSFLQNMLLNIGNGHYIQVCMYTVYMNFRQNFSPQKNYFCHFNIKTLNETVHYIPKGLRKGNPFHGPFAQLSCILPRLFYIYTAPSVLSIILIRPIHIDSTGATVKLTRPSTFNSHQPKNLDVPREGSGGYSLYLA